ncbi:hypothetical protein NPIL_704941 [Nephila pilipes]|uniref:Uncharacterized protein n=1 Tax=Nephila pilipes TaxID=299642 RepID=A0A8X6QD28_NEPPI|nr:hypothetical protein NPIL_704941 [Nephila pilipes]
MTLNARAGCQLGARSRNYEARCSCIPPAGSTVRELPSQLGGPGLDLPDQTCLRRLFVEMGGTGAWTGLDFHQLLLSWSSYLILPEPDVMQASCLQLP